LAGRITPGWPDLTNCTNAINQQPDAKKRNLLDQLPGVEEIVKHLPADKAGKRSQGGENLEVLVKQATSRSRREWYSLSAQGLLEASQWTKSLGNFLEHRPDRQADLAGFSLPKGA